MGAPDATIPSRRGEERGSGSGSAERLRRHGRPEVRGDGRAERACGAVDDVGPRGIPYLLVEDLDLDVAVVPGGLDGGGERREVDHAVARFVPREQRVGGDG